MMASREKCNICSGRVEIKGFRACHCSECHETFTSVSGFDAHRGGSFGKPDPKDGTWSASTRVCHIPGGYSRNYNGYWASDRLQEVHG